MKHRKTYILVFVGLLVSLTTLCYVILQLDMAPFGFLGGYAYLDRVALNGLDDIVCIDKYLTQADFNTICLEATTELGTLGYVEIQSSRIPNHQIFFRKYDKKGQRIGSILITSGDKYDLLDKSNNPRADLDLASDWILVAVSYRKPKNRLLEKTAEIIAEQARD